MHLLATRVAILAPLCIIYIAAQIHTRLFRARNLYQHHTVTKYFSYTVVFNHHCHRQSPTQSITIFCIFYMGNRRGRKLTLGTIISS
jgi:hypothetical protein